MRVYDRPESAREVEGRVRIAQLLRWCQSTNYAPSSTESRVLLLGLDEMCERTIDMTFMACALSVRMTSLWFRMRFATRWALPVYAGLVVADRRRMIQTMKMHSSYVTLLAVAEIESPLGREARRLLRVSDKLLETFDKSPEAAQLNWRTAAYHRQIFFWHRALGPFVGPIVSHATLWHTLHSVFEGSALMHRIAPGSGEEASLVQLTAMGRDALDALQEKVTKKARKAGYPASSLMLATRPLADSTAKLWASLQCNFRWVRWQIFEAATVESDTLSSTAFAVTLPAMDSRCDFVVRELRRTPQVTAMWWLPARVWWGVRFAILPSSPPTPNIDT